VTTIAQLLSNTSLDKTDARVLLGHLLEFHLGWSRSALISQDQEILPDQLIAAWKRLEAQRLSGVPVAYLVGKKAFHGIELQVNDAVLIPRPETELLVDVALEEIKQICNSSPKALVRIMDLGTGSGAIALAIAHAWRSMNKSSPRIEILGIDQSPAALQIARENAQELGLNETVRFLESNWYTAITDIDQGNIDVIVSNPPYIRKEDPHLELGDLRFEPKAALTDQGDGLECIRTILLGAALFLRPGGLIALEHGYDQAADVASLLHQNAFVQIHALPDLAGHLRVSMARI